MIKIFLLSIYVLSGDVANTEVYVFKNERHFAAILPYQPTIAFSARLKNDNSNPKIRTFERLLKNKFSIRRNIFIENTVERYIIFAASSPHDISNLAELRRLNI